MDSSSESLSSDHSSGKPSSSETPTSLAASLARPSGAAHAVLNTNELLCDIIVRLPFKDIFNATGVCQTWRKALKDNVAIRQAMFLDPVGVTDITSEMDCLSMKVEDIPRDQFSVIGEIHSFVPHKWEERNLFDDRCSTQSLSKRPFGVWADMFVTQPPVKTFNIILRLASPVEHLPDIDFLFTCETGVKMGALHDFARSKFLSSDKAVTTRVVPKNFIEGKLSRDRIGGRWEVRDGKVCRQTQLRLAELPDPDSDSDESGYSDEERYNCSFDNYDNDYEEDYYGDGGDDDGGDYYNGEY
jgi:hypothetical protein